MSPWLFAKLVRTNLPHLLGILLYGVIAILLALLCYKLFSKVIGLNNNLDSSAQERLSSVVLAVGVIIGISFIVGVTAYQPPKTEAPPTSSSASSSSDGCGSCGSKHPIKPATAAQTASAPNQTQQKASQQTGTQGK